MRESYPHRTRWFHLVVVISFALCLPSADLAAAPVARRAAKPRPKPVVRNVPKPIGPNVAKVKSPQQVRATKLSHIRNSKIPKWRQKPLPRQYIQRLPQQRPVAPILPSTRSWTKYVMVGGKKVVVPEPTVFLVNENVSGLASAEEEEEEASGDSDQATAAASDTKLLEEESNTGPVSEFGMLADQRLRELLAYQDVGQATNDTIVQGEDGKYHKAYYRFELQSIQLSIVNQEPLELEGTIAYNSVLYVQSADTQDGVVNDAGTPHKETEPIASVEKYRFQEGQWSYMESE